MDFDRLLAKLNQLAKGLSAAEIELTLEVIRAVKSFRDANCRKQRISDTTIKRNCRPLTKAAAMADNTRISVQCLQCLLSWHEHKVIINPEAAHSSRASTGQPTLPIEFIKELHWVILKPLEEMEAKVRKGSCCPTKLQDKTKS